MAEFFFGITDKGKRRPNNEDTFIALTLPGKTLLGACVIDGVGGYSGGEVAAGIAKTVILEHLQNFSGDVIAALKIAFIAANTAIHGVRKKNKENGQMACVLTCAIADIKNNKLFYAHVGDTRLYLLRDASLVKLSTDHSAVGFLEESGRLSEEDAMRHPRRNEINKALGFEENIDGADFIETGESPFLPGDTVLLCSDGLSDMIASETICTILRNNKSLTATARKLVDAANEAGGDDNITVVLVKNTNKPVLKFALKPAGSNNSASTSALRLIKDLAVKSPEITKNSNRSFSGYLILFFLCFITLLLLQQNSAISKKHVLLQPAIFRTKNPAVNLFIQSTTDSAKNYSFPGKQGVLSLSAPVYIKKDSFRITGNGITIIADSNYKGPALIVSGDVKHLVLDSIIFKDFDVVVSVLNSNTFLKNVRFLNCRIPVQYGLLFSDSLVSGRLKDSVFILMSELNHSK